MTEPSEPTAAPPTASTTTDTSAAELDFERAAFDQPDDAKRICNVCGRPIVDNYYTHASTTICPQCQPTYARTLGTSSFAAALGYGLLAAALGALVWYGIRALTDYELGIIAVAVGVAVGVAVRKGAGPSRAVGYRALAVFLAYSSIVSTYVPVFAAGLMQGESPDPSLTVTQGEAPPSGPLYSAIAYVIAYGVAFMLPYFLLSAGEVMGVIIMGIALWEAWRLSAPRAEDHVQGPFQIGAAG